MKYNSIKFKNNFFDTIKVIFLGLFSFFICYYYGFIGITPLDDFVNFNCGYRILSGDIPFKDYYSILYSKIPFIEDISQLQNYPFYVYYSLKSFFDSPQKLKINIKFKDYKKINFIRELALNGEKEF